MLPRKVHFLDLTGIRLGLLFHMVNNIHKPDFPFLPPIHAGSAGNGFRKAARRWWFEFLGKGKEYTLGLRIDGRLRGIELLLVDTGGRVFVGFDSLFSV